MYSVAHENQSGAGGVSDSTLMRVTGKLHDIINTSKMVSIVPWILLSSASLSRFAFLEQSMFHVPFATRLESTVPKTVKIVVGSSFKNDTDADAPYYVGEMDQHGPEMWSRYAGISKRFHPEWRMER